MNDTKQIMQNIEQLGSQAKKAARQIAVAKTQCKNNALEKIAQLLDQHQQELITANQKDLTAGEEKSLSAALLDRLELTPNRIQSMIEGLSEIIALADPINIINDLVMRPSGIQVGRMRVPLGVVGIIYESRPNVTIDASALCLKSGNACILRGGSEAIHSNQALAKYIRQGLQAFELPEDAVQVIETTDRAAVTALLNLGQYVDVIIPRGGKGLVKLVSEQAKMPVIKHLHGVCHVYIDTDTDIDKAVNIAFNAKTQRYGTCNTMECLLIAQPVAKQILAKLAPMLQQKGVEIRGCEQSTKLLPDISLATEEDYYCEYLAPIMSLRIVKDAHEAIDHITQYGSQHTDAIVTENFTTARYFLQAVDSSSVMVNASTRFADGFEYGLGAEIGISTDKFHARGPVGLLGLTSQKYIVLGDGHIRE